MLPKRFIFGVWLTITLAGALISAVSEVRDNRHARDVDPLIRSALGVLVQRGAASLAEGAPARERFLRRLSDDAFGEPFGLVVLDARGRVVGAAGASSTAEAALAHLGARARRSGRLETERAGRLLLAARAAETPLGKSWVVAAASPAADRFTDTPPGELVVRHLAIIVVTGFGCLALSRYSSRPIMKVRHVSRRMAEGDFRIRLPQAYTTRKDALGGMVRDFNAMANRVQAMVESQNRMRRDVSHELRSPLARLQIAVDLARRHAAETGPLDRIETEIKRIDKFVSDLLTYDSVHGAYERALDDHVRLARLMRGVMDDVGYEAADRGVALKAQRMDECVVNGSPTLLRSALENVVRNAVRYAAEGTDVDILLRRDAARVVAVIRDRGPGVPPDALERIFEPFYRVETARSRQRGGTGLGLSIAQRIVTAHGGEIRASNHPEGGLSIEIGLPLTHV